MRIVYTSENSALIKSIYEIRNIQIEEHDGIKVFEYIRKPR